MDNRKRKFLKECMKKWQRVGRKVIPCASSCGMCGGDCSFWHEEKIVPSDVPKGHLVVYVGEYHKRRERERSKLESPEKKKSSRRRRQRWFGAAGDSRREEGFDGRVEVRRRKER
ncbi:hypothetical protein RD792_014137 [Penstemon davidsonii]|uniref:Uncharacterized protein n=1 Tax=Penstemon davidsonii TaxID=160366 RepID=A0ABR0CNG7_9LAMI|nr:hypothetical protein RD792_014137 [Penstemon davidsonii]